MRVAIVTESFLPTLNGVTTSVCRVLDRLADLGHDAIVICPGPAPAAYRGFRVHPVRSMTLRQFRVGLPTRDLERVLDELNEVARCRRRPRRYAAAGMRRPRADPAQLISSTSATLVRRR